MCFTPSGLWTLLALSEIITVIVSLLNPIFPISHNLRYTPAQPTLFISLHLTSPPLKLHPHVKTIYVALALRWEVQMILCRETDEVFLGLLNLPSD